MQSQDFVRRLHGIRDSRPARRLHLDLLLIIILALLCGGGLLVLYSASSKNAFYVERQAIFMGIGFFAMLAIAQFPPRFWERWAFLLYGTGLVLLVLVIFVGVGAKGAQRWLDIGVTRVQPSELMKIGLPVMASAYLGKRHMPPGFKHVFWATVLAAVPAALVILQPDLGTALLILATGFFVLFLAGLQMRYLITAGLLALGAIPSLWFFVMRDYQKQRVLILLNPEDDKLGAGWNIIQSMTAIGSGGMEGKGWTLGTQSQLDFLPESHTDFIIAVLAEEFGLIGVLVLLTGYLLLIARCMVISAQAQTNFGRLLAGSIGLTFFVYVFVNMGMVSGILPIVGVPLPLVSYGGTAIVTLFIGFGMLMAISTEPKRI